MGPSTYLSRRQFVQTAATGLAAPMLLSTASPARASANDRIQLGFIGVGTMGGGHVSSFSGSPDVQVVAVCDVVRERREHHQKVVDTYYAKAKKGEYKGCKAYTD